MSTGLVYDEQMCLHEESGHPECPDRIKQTYSAILSQNLIDLCKQIPIREATIDELRSMHTEDHVNKMLSTTTMSSVELYNLQNSLDSVYLNSNSYKCALLSAGGVIELAEQIMNGNISNGLAIVRPPGHHAESHCAMGFCLFNNVALAAKKLIDSYGLERIVIFDWDVHHGNATQRMFESDPKVLYISIHRYDNGRFYPGTKDGDPCKIGEGDGKGFNINIGLDTRYYLPLGNAEYAYIFEKLIKPILTEYDPQFIIVSAGFDCCLGDPLGGLEVRPDCFRYMTSNLLKYAEGKVLIALEGGYNVNAVSESMTECLKALTGDRCYTMTYDNASRAGIDAMLETKCCLRKYWKCLQ
jgi:acetoin utilization deacetylase AcuC-like enzyme